jgi:hypothetical protein
MCSFEIARRGCVGISSQDIHVLYHSSRSAVCAAAENSSVATAYGEKYAATAAAAAEKGQPSRRGLLTGISSACLLSLCSEW